MCFFQDVFYEIPRTRWAQNTTTAMNIFCAGKQINSRYSFLRGVHDTCMEKTSESKKMWWWYIYSYVYIRISVCYFTFTYHVFHLEDIWRRKIAPRKYLLTMARYDSIIFVSLLSQLSHYRHAQCPQVQKSTETQFHTNIVTIETTLVKKTYVNLVSKMTWEGLVRRKNFPGEFDDGRFYGNTCVWMAHTAKCPYRLCRPQRYSGLFYHTLAYENGCTVMGGFRQCSEGVSGLSYCQQRKLLQDVSVRNIQFVKCQAGVRIPIFPGASWSHRRILAPLTDLWLSRFQGILVSQVRRVLRV